MLPHKGVKSSSQAKCSSRPALREYRVAAGRVQSAYGRPPAAVESGE